MNYKYIFIGYTNITCSLRKALEYSINLYSCIVLGEAPAIALLTNSFIILLASITVMSSSQSGHFFFFVNKTCSVMHHSQKICPQLSTTGCNENKTFY